MKGQQNKRSRLTVILILVSISAVAIFVLCFLFNKHNESTAGELSLINILKTIGISIIPVIELRGAIPIAVGSYGMSLANAFLFSYIGNCIIIPPTVLLTRTVFDWLKNLKWLRVHIKWLHKLIMQFENHIRLKGEKALKYAELGLLLFVAIPIPGTGAWTGAMIAGLLNIRMKTATPIIAVGVLVAGTIITTLTYGAVKIF